MDGRHFDSFVRSLATGTNRRQVLRGLFGLGVAAVAGGARLDVEAARRPTGNPTPIPSCPGMQTWDGKTCICPSGEPCGPDCCPAGAECCDNACCYGTCYGEELCCATPLAYCVVSNECCAEGWSCCADFGCIAPGQCCTSDECENESCASAYCGSDHICAHEFDCREGDCCSAERCYRSDCADDGTCLDSVFDCTRHDETSCCGVDAICNPDGSCTTPVVSIDGECVLHAVISYLTVSISGFLANTTYLWSFDLDGTLYPAPPYAAIVTDGFGAGQNASIQNFSISGVYFSSLRVSVDGVLSNEILCH